MAFPLVVNNFNQGTIFVISTHYSPNKFFSWLTYMTSAIIKCESILQLISLLKDKETVIYGLILLRFTPTWLRSFQFTLLSLILLLSHIYNYLCKQSAICIYICWARHHYTKLCLIQQENTFISVCIHQEFAQLSFIKKYIAYQLT